MQASIIIPNYNYAKYVGEAIESALNQTVKAEVIVVDDGSTDNSLKVIRQYPVKLIAQSNKGLPGARNAGIKEATGEWILPLDSDDKIDPTFLEKTIGKGDIVATGMQEFGENNRKYLPPSELTYKNFISHNNIYCCSLFRKKVWETVGGYDEKMTLGLEDWQFWLKSLYAGFGLSVVPEYLFFYRKHGHSMIDETLKRHKEAFSDLKKTLPGLYERM